MSETELNEAEQAIKDAEAALAEARRKANDKEYPKWIEPHASHIDHSNDHISVPLFPEFHIDRAGKVTVLVQDAEHEAKALAQKVLETAKKDD